MFRSDMVLDAAIDDLNRLHTAAGNVINLPDPVMAYVDWADKAERFLRGLYTSHAPADKILSRRYWGLTENSSPAFIYKQLTAEIRLVRHQLEELTEEIKSLRKIGERPGRLAVPDTNVLLHFQRIDRVNWPDVLGERGPIRLVIPILILDELDEKRYTGSDKVRKIARTALQPLVENQAAIEKDGYAEILAGTTVEYLFVGGDGAKGNPDSDILDQAVLLQHVTDRDVTILSGDIGMRARAVTRGLQAVTMPSRLARNQDEVRNEQFDD